MRLRDTVRIGVSWRTAGMRPTPYNPRMLVAREFRFEAAHRLPDHPGPCRHLHGHSYRLRVVCQAPVDATTGLALDFGALKETVHEHVIAPLDHSDLNDLLSVPSAEHIAIWAWEQLAEAGLPLYEIEVQETAACSVVYRGEE